MRSALAFLTVLPVGRQDRPPGRAALLAFPLVGLIIGAVWALVALGAARWWGPLAAAAAVVAADALATGGLHLDGVADIGDVAGSRRRGPEALEVARDPHVGALGVVAVVGVLLLRFALIAALLAGAEGSGPIGSHPVWLLVAVPVVGRAVMVLALAWSPRSGTSSARRLAETARVPIQLTALTIAAVTLLVTGAGPGRTLIAMLAALVATAALLAWWRRRVGASSGDLVGAAGVLAETAVLAVLAWQG